VDNKIDDGGPAFPKAGLDPWQNAKAVHIGMSLRDHFAGLAMQGILAGDHPITHELDALKSVPRSAYEFADAMLKARSA
jgi:hypothetical protein